MRVNTVQTPVVLTEVIVSKLYYSLYTYLLLHFFLFLFFFDSFLPNYHQFNVKKITNDQLRRKRRSCVSSVVVFIVVCEKNIRYTVASKATSVQVLTLYLYQEKTFFGSILRKTFFFMLSREKKQLLLFEVNTL